MGQSYERHIRFSERLSMGLVQCSTTVHNFGGNKMKKIGNIKGVNIYSDSKVPKDKIVAMPNS